MGDWQPIATAPTDGTKFLGVTKYGRMKVDWFDATLSTSQFQFSHERGDDGYTHWMPLPVAPSPQHHIKESTMSDHDLKVWPDYFDALADGRKSFEIRKDDRGFKIGDTLRLREYSPGPDEYTGREITRTVSYILSGDGVMGRYFGLRTGFVALGLSGPITTVIPGAIW